MKIFPGTLLLILVGGLFGCFHSSGGSKQKPVDLTKVKLPEASIWETKVSKSSQSPIRVMDLNNDGVKDIVQGHGYDGSDVDLDRYVEATDGKTGERLWRAGKMNDMFGNAVFTRINDDDIYDVVISGRDGELVALNGVNGKRIWSFNKNAKYQGETGLWFNFYTPQLIGDTDGDGVEELVTTTIFYSDVDASVTSLLVIVDGASGKGSYHEVKEGPGVETYMSPLVLKNKDGSRDVIYGTGGEDQIGSLWRLPLKSLLNGRTGKSVELFKGAEKGLIPPPSLADMNNDGQLDIVLAAYEGHMIVFDGTDNSEIWRQENFGFETYCSPTIGYFVGDDDIPDVFIGINKGIWFDYKRSDYLLINGKNGKVVWRKTYGNFTPTNALAIDLNNDDVDEIIFNYNDAFEALSQILMLDTQELTIKKLTPVDDGVNVGSHWIGDLDGDNKLEFLRTNNPSFLLDQGHTLSRYDLDIRAPKRISWQGYLGNNGDGVFESR